MKSFRRNYVLSFGIVVTLVVITAVSCSGKPEKLVAPVDTGEAPPKEAGKSVELAQELSGVKYSQSKDGRLQWELVADAVHQVADGPTKLEGVKINYYADDGKVILLTADSGTYEDATRNVTLRGNVVVNTSDGNHLNTDALSWNQKSGTLRGEGDVKMTRGGSIIKGKGFELLPKSETVNIYDVEGIIRKKEMNL